MLTLQPCDREGEKDDSRTPVVIKRSGEPVLLGRNVLTGIIDKKLSRNHVEVQISEGTGSVVITQRGSHSGSFNNQPLKQGESKTVENGDVFFLLSGRYAYKVLAEETGETSHPQDEDGRLMNPQDDPLVKSTPTKRRAAEVEAEEPQKKRPKMSEGGLSEKQKVKQRDKAQGSSVEKRKVEEMEEDASYAKDKHHKRVKTEQGDLSIEEKLKALQQNVKKERSQSGSSSRDGRKLREESVQSGGKAPAKTSQTGSISTEEKWEEHGKMVIYTAKGVKASSKMAGFDLDGTIITTNSGKVFPKDINDWKIYLPETYKKLKQLIADGYKVVFFTNQMGIGKGKLKLEDFKKKLSRILEKLAIPVQVFIATGSGIYRKPCLGMWNYFKEKMNDDIMLDLSSSVFVGDAAGRPAEWAPKRKKDFSCSDRLFALNAGLPFKTPEEFFQGMKPSPFSLPKFDPRLPVSKPLLEPSAELPLSTQEVLLLVGFPASGKSTFVKRHLLQHKYVHINRDTMGSWQKCVAACQASLKKGQSVVVDNTNPDVESRKRYVDCAKSAGIPCRCFTFNVTQEQARHNEKFRSLTPSGKNHASIPDMIFHSYKNKFAEPKLQEGFKEMVRVNFIPSFNNSKEEILYKQFLLEK